MPRTSSPSDWEPPFQAAMAIRRDDFNTWVKIRDAYAAKCRLDVNNEKYHHELMWETLNEYSAGVPTGFEVAALEYDEAMRAEKIMDGL